MPTFGIKTSKTNTIKLSNHIIDKDNVIKSNYCSDMCDPYYINITTYIIKAFERKMKKMNEYVLYLLSKRSLLFYLSRKLNLSCEKQNIVVQSLN